MKQTLRKKLFNDKLHLIHFCRIRKWFICIISRFCIGHLQNIREQRKKVGKTIYKLKKNDKS
uniref:Uncharacterized protein n=1 Tax=Brugia timori TaxID=42155 RepID=A0A0R3QCP4_9BILA